MASHNSYWLKKPLVVTLGWFFLSIALGIFGLWYGTRTVIPGPTNKETLLQNPGERESFRIGLPPRDTFVVVLSHASLPYDSAEFVAARESLVQRLSELRTPDGESDLLRRVETVGHTFIGDHIFVGKSDRSILLRASTVHSIDGSGPEMRVVPPVVQEWSKENPNFQIGYISDGSVNNELFDTIDRDLDSSLKYTIPVTFVILLWAFGSVVAALVPLVIATVSLIA
ncbi:MAG: MMPL family transporter, partial [Bdellovibrionales bacterium]|nr:MMPL family transporter [Bdellovibrionales bacterium]